MPRKTDLGICHAPPGFVLFEVTTTTDAMIEAPVCAQFGGTPHPYV